MEKSIREEKSRPSGSWAPVLLSMRSEEPGALGKALIVEPTQNLQSRILWGPGPRNLSLEQSPPFVLRHTDASELPHEDGHEWAWGYQDSTQSPEPKAKPLVTSIIHTFTLKRDEDSGCKIEDAYEFITQMFYS